MTLRCHTCGYRSANHAFFRVERGGMLDRKLAVCAGCAPYRPDASARAACRSTILGALFGGLFAWRYAVDFGTFAQGASLFAASVFSAPFCIIAHELGHAAMAKALGSRVLSIEIGMGPLREVARFDGIRLEWRQYVMLGGLIRHVPADPTSGWRRALIAFAGPLTNIVLALAFALLPAWLDDEGHIAGAACTGLMLANLGFAIINLIAWRGPTGTTENEDISDGGRILQAFSRRPALSAEETKQLSADRLAALGRPEEAALIYQELLAPRPCDAFYLCKIVHHTDRAIGPSAALALYRRLVVSGPPDRPWPGGPMEAYLNGSLAWCAIRNGDEEDLGQADHLAPTALAGLPDSSELKATLGALLVLRGRSDSGEPLLLAGLRDTRVEAPDRIAFCGFLAKARALADDPAMVADYRALSLHIAAR